LGQKSLAVVCRYSHLAVDNNAVLIGEAIDTIENIELLVLKGHLLVEHQLLRFIAKMACFGIAIIGSTSSAGAGVGHFIFRAFGFNFFAGFRTGFFAATLIASGVLNFAASSEPRVALPALYECLPVPASCPRSTIKYSLRIGRLSK
jgi:hypothetical protein